VDGGPRCSHLGPTEVDPFNEFTPPARIWYAIRKSRIDEVLPLPEDAAAALEITIATGGRTANLAAIVKPLVDGVIAAFQAHEGIGWLDEIARRLSVQLPVPAAELRALLEANPPPCFALGDYSI
jgi:hypothetical protein